MRAGEVESAGSQANESDESDRYLDSVKHH